MYTILLIALTTLGYLINIKGIKFYSFLVWTITNLCWGSLNFYRGHYDMTVMFAIYICFCMYGLYVERHNTAIDLIKSHFKSSLNKLWIKKK